MEIDEYCSGDNQRRRERDPRYGGKAQRTDQSAREHATHSRDEKKKRGDRDAAKKSDGGGERVAATIFWPPCIWRQPLKSMKYDAHPEPAGEDGHDSCNRSRR